MQRQFLVFLIRWPLNSLGLWIAVRLLGSGYSDTQIDSNVGVFLLAGLIFSIVNSILKPLIIILSLPFILITLGLFIVVVNGLMVYISLQLTPGLQMSFFNSILAGIILSLINYVVSSVIEMRIRRKGKS